jgi:hypothetical protein
MGTGGTPTIPLFIGQGAYGDLEWTPGNKPGIGAGDGVMIAGDVRTLAHIYCEKGTTVYYEQYARLSHITSVPFWLVKAMTGSWIASLENPRRRTVRRYRLATRWTRFRFRSPLRRMSPWHSLEASRDCW